MRMGICAPIEKIRTVYDLGFDYIELPLNKIVELSDEQFDAMVGEIKKLPIDCEVVYVYFPRTMKIVGPEADYDDIARYLDIATERMKILGVKIGNVGCGGSRSVPDGYDRKSCIEDFKNVLIMAADRLEKEDTILVVEPLNKRMSNIINTVSEGAELVREINHPKIKLLADFFHMRLENEPMQCIIDAKDIIKHAHIARGRWSRDYPKERNEDSYDEFFEALKKINYSGRLSLESVSNNFARDAAISLNLVRELSKDHGL